MTNLPSWWLWGIMFIPFYGLFLFYKLMVATAALYGKSAGFGAGLFFLGFVFWPMLGFGETNFQSATPATGGFPVGAVKHALIVATGPRLAAPAQRTLSARPSRVCRFCARGQTRVTSKFGVRREKK